ncbi:translation initiation factor IF-3 [Paenibacillus sepulcri]
MIVNEKIKAAEVQLTGLKGEDLGVVPTSEALAMARKLKVDLVCTSLMSSPPPCKLMSRGLAKQAAAADKRESTRNQPAKLKEIRLTAAIEDHDYDTKLRQSEKLLSSGNAVQLVIRLKGKEGPKAKELLERMLKDLAASGKKDTGIQVSGKQASVRVNPL